MSTPVSAPTAHTVSERFDALTDLPALVQWSGGRATPWPDWRATSRLWAQHWLACGIERGDRVLGLSHNRAECLIALLALARIGAIWVPLNHRLSPAEWSAIIDDCQPRWLLHDDAWYEAAAELARAHALQRSNWADLPKDHSDRDFADASQATDAALLVYTSGTTGRPKAAVHTQANLCANMRLSVASLGLKTSDTVLSALPLFHVGGLCIHTLPALSIGARVVVMERFDAGDAWHALEATQATRMLQVPATLRAMLDHPAGAHADVRALKGFDAGSSVIPHELFAAWRKRGVSIGNVYGATETGPVSLVLPMQLSESHEGSSGWPARASEEAVVALIHDLTTQSPIDQGIGEIWLRGPNIVESYWPKTPSHNAQGWFATGDLGERAADGSIRVVGRSKDMIITGGENVWAAEVEQALLSHPDVAECAVWGEPDAQWGERVVAGIVWKAISEKIDSMSADSGHSLLSFLEHAKTLQLQQHLQTQLAKYKWPRTWRLAQSIPKTALGKPQKHVLRAASLALKATGTAHRQ